MTILNRTIIDINHALIGIEKIALKYLKYPDGVYYIDGLREPITNLKYIKKYFGTNKLSETPKYPLYAAYILRDIWYKYLKDLIATGDLDNGEELLNKNPLIPNGISIYPNIKLNTSIESIISETIPNISLKDLNLIYRDIKYTLKWLKNIIKDKPNSIYTVDISNRYIILEEHEDIRVFRFQEALEYNELLKEYERTYKYE